MTFLTNIYDVLGNEVTTLINEFKNAGSYETDFSATGGSASGGDASALSSGVYFYRIAIHSDQIKAGNFVKVKKMMLMK